MSMASCWSTVAAVRAGLLSPAVDAIGPLHDLTPSISRPGTVVGQLTEALLVTFYSGLDHGAARHVVAEAAGIEAHHAESSRSPRTC